MLVLRGYWDTIQALKIPATQYRSHHLSLQRSHCETKLSLHGGGIRDYMPSCCDCGPIDFSAKVIERLSDFTSKTDEMPEAFRAINTQLPLLSKTLQQVQTQAEKGYDVPTAKALTTVVVNSINLTTKLEAILEKTLPGRNATTF